MNFKRLKEKAKWFTFFDSLELIELMIVKIITKTIDDSLIKW